MHMSLYIEFRVQWFYLGVHLARLKLVEVTNTGKSRIYVQQFTQIVV